MAHLTVKEVIENLSKLDENAIVCVGIRQHNKAYAVASPYVFMVDSCYGGATLWCSLPEGMYTVDKNK